MQADCCNEDDKRKNIRKQMKKKCICVIEKTHLLNCRCDTFVNITSPMQLQDGTTYDSNNIMHHICKKSTEIYSEILVIFSQEGCDGFSNLLVSIFMHFIQYNMDYREFVRFYSMYLHHEVRCYG